MVQNFALIGRKRSVTQNRGLGNPVTLRGVQDQPHSLWGAVREEHVGPSFQNCGAFQTATAECETERTALLKAMRSTRPRRHLCCLLGVAWIHGQLSRARRFTPKAVNTDQRLDRLMGFIPNGLIQRPTGEP